jgi:hypothetical protein
MMRLLNTPCAAGVSRARMTMEYTHDNCYNMHLTFSTCNSRIGTAAQEKSTIRVLSWSTSSRRYCVSTIGAASPWDRMCNNYDTRERRSPKGYMDTNHWRRHNWSCVVGVVEKDTRYYTRVGTVPNEGHRSASWRTITSIPLLAERTSVSWRTSSTGAILRMAATSTHCRWYHFTWYSVDIRSIFYS